MLKTDLDPWRVLRSFVSDVTNSYEIPNIIDKAGLAVNWQLTPREDGSHTTRRAAYRPRIDEAYNALSSEDDRLRVTFIVARELAKRGYAENLNEALNAIGWNINGDRLIPADQSVRELFFPKGSQHDAYVEIREILQQATATVLIVDPYMDQSTLTLLATCAKPTMKIELLTTKLPADFDLEAKKFATQHADIAMSVRKTRDFHDRFIVLDGTKCWHIGCSVKDAGNKAFMLSEVEDETNRSVLIAQIRKAWDAAPVVV